MADIETVPTPVRVLVDAEGTAYSSRRAMELHGIQADYLFVRNDGWVLGAPADLREAARALWRGSWAEEWRRNADGWARTWPLPE